VTLCASQLPVGFELPSFRRTITREMAKIHAAPMSNFHTVLSDAQALGYPDIVIAGPMFICFFSEMFTRFFGEGWITSGDMEFKLFEPVFANQTITARAVAARHERLNGRVRVGLDIWCERQEDGKKTSAGSASVTLDP
jgi:hydroxyacyl-ACP dehydratase HTD2-like protein with hotdog domain